LFDTFRKVPFFKSTYNILKAPWEDEVHNPNWFDSDKLILPPGGPNDSKFRWDYGREMTVDDVDIWEQLYYSTGGLGVYAAWCPFAEFYMITLPTFSAEVNLKIETFYGPGASQKTFKRARELNIPLSLNSVWVEPEDMWLHQATSTVNNKIIL
jgi:hypothetical protein